MTSKITGKKLENTVFDIGGGRPKVGPFAFEKKLLSAVWYEGTPYEFNFSKFWTLSRTKFKCRETEDKIQWHVVQTTWNSKLDTKIQNPIPAAKTSGKPPIETPSSNNTVPSVPINPHLPSLLDLKGK